MPGISKLFRMAGLGLAILLCSFFPACKKPQVHTVNVVVTGHSLVAGMHWNRDLGRADILNAGRGGQSTFVIYENLQALVLDHKPKLCLLLLGYDTRNGIQDTVFKTVQNITNELLAAGIDVVLQASIPYGASAQNFDVYNPNFEIHNDSVRNWVAARNDPRLHFFDINPLLTDENGIRLAHLTQDGIHLNDRGNAIWIAEFARFLAENAY